VFKQVVSVALLLILLVVELMELVLLSTEHKLVPINLFAQVMIFALLQIAQLPRLEAQELAPKQISTVMITILAQSMIDVLLLWIRTETQLQSVNMTLFFALLQQTLVKTAFVSTKMGLLLVRQHLSIVPLLINVQLECVFSEMHKPFANILKSHAAQIIYAAVIFVILSMVAK
jgi:hypothetical protein